MIVVMNKRIGRWRGEADKSVVPTRTLRDDWLRAGDLHDVQGPNTTARKQDEYTAAADFRSYPDDDRRQRCRGSPRPLTGESIHGFTASPKRTHRDRSRTPRTQTVHE